MNTNTSKINTTADKATQTPMEVGTQTDTVTNSTLTIKQLFKIPSTSSYFEDFETGEPVDYVRLNYKEKLAIYRTLKWACVESKKQEVKNKKKRYICCKELYQDDPDLYPFQWKEQDCLNKDPCCSCCYKMRPTADFDNKAGHCQICDTCSLRYNNGEKHFCSVLFGYYWTCNEEKILTENLKTCCITKYSSSGDCTSKTYCCPCCDQCNSNTYQFRYH